MKCPKCNGTLFIGKTFMTFEGDDSPDTPTIAYQNLPMICTNPQCDMYGGKDLTNPKQVVTTLKNRMN